MVGETGKVFGVDMTPNMIALRAKEPVESGSSERRVPPRRDRTPADRERHRGREFSNCVIINLSPDKARSSARHSACSTGGRLQVSDIVWTQPAPEAIKDDMEQWAGCIAARCCESDYLGAIRAAASSKSPRTRRNTGG